MNNLNTVLSFELLTLSGVPVTVASVLICLVAFIVSMIVAQLVRRTVERAIRSRGRSPGVAAAIGKIAWYILVFIGAFISLDTLGFNLTALLAGSAVLLVGIGFGLQNIAQNFISGIIVLIERPIQEGDFVKVGEATGWVRNVGLRGTRVVTREEVSIIVPNSEFVSSQVVNLSSPSSRIRTSVDVGVEYGSDVKLTRSALLSVAGEQETILKTPPPEVLFKDFGDSALIFTLRFWIDDPPEDSRICSAVRFGIDEAFREHGLVIAFPQQDLHIRSGLDVLAKAVLPSA